MTVMDGEAESVQNWRECVQCGFISVLPEMQPALVAECPRCRHTLWRMPLNPFDFSLACAMAGLLFYIFAVAAPFLEISAYGRFQMGHLITGPLYLSNQGFRLLALLVLSVTIIFPGFKLGIMIFTLLGLESRWVPRRLLKFLFRWYRPLTPWAMIDVYLLGFLVAYTRLSAIATVHLDTALYSLIGLMICMAAADASFDTEAVWRALDKDDHSFHDHHHHHHHRHHHAAPAPLGTHLIGCDCCGFMNQGESGEHCRRCGAVLHERKVNPISRSWALLIASICLYIPANIYPVMSIVQLGALHQFTIMGGIVELVDYGLWPLAGLVFFASITIPLLKLITLAYILISTQQGRPDRLIGRLKAYRLIHFIGRWSMIDVFMISILVALVRFQQFANVHAEIGAGCFASVVVLTMFAVDFFDPRVMWDAAAAPPVTENTMPGKEVAA